jgi:hypothetical protein
MTTSMRRFGRPAVRLAVLVLAAAAPTAAGAALDGSSPLLCAITTIMECDGSGQCQRHASGPHAEFPAFLRVNVGERVITDGQTSGRKTEIKSAAHLDGRLILHGGENGRGWAATIAEDTGRMSAGVVADHFTFALFGACTAP